MWMMTPPCWRALQIQIFVPSTSPQHDNLTAYDDTTMEFTGDKKNQREKTAIEKNTILGKDNRFLKIKRVFKARKQEKKQDILPHAITSDKNINFMQTLFTS